MTTEGGSEKRIRKRPMGGSKGKEDTKGGAKITKGYKGLKAARAGDADIAFTSQSVREKNRGIAKDQHKWERDRPTEVGERTIMAIGFGIH